VEVLGFSTEVGLPITLAGVGLHELPRARLEPIARRATAPGETIQNEPFAVTPEMVADAILTAGALGPAWKKDRRDTKHGESPS
jgi:glycerol dehydrogenase